MKQIVREFRDDMKGSHWRLGALTAAAAVCELFTWQLRGPAASPEAARFIWAPFPAEHLPFYSMVNSILIYYFFYLILPLAVVLVLFRGDMRSFGLGSGGLRKYFPVYALLLAAIVPFIIAASYQDGFRETYPFMRVPVFSLMVIWEVLYFFQFLCVEFFFRGFLLFPFCRRFGTAGVLVPLIPYCLIHLDKPLPEALGSVITGLLLGYFAWKSRSVWGGVLLHGLAALLMDLMALSMGRG